MQVDDSSAAEDAATQVDPELMLADPRFRGMHNLLKWLMVSCMVFLIVQCSFYLPYFLFKWGWSR